MQNENFSSYDKFYTAAAATSATEYGGAYEKSFFVDDFFLSPKNHGSFYSSLFSEPSATTSESSFDDSDDFAAESRLHRGNFILKYQQLYNRYSLCLAHLQESINELDALRLENADLTQRLRLLYDFNRLPIGAKSSNVRDSQVTTFSEPPPTDHNLLERQNHEGFSLPKSISVRSSDYLKLKLRQGNSSSRNSTRRRVNIALSGSQRTCTPVAKRSEEQALELEACNQGMMKTELCNKWEETGACPYGDNCQFAHGINELRPVMRHPRYKTQVCRMVLAGQPCPYGHRCHFRHSLTHQERLIASQPQR